MTKFRLQALDRIRDRAVVGITEKDMKLLDRDYVILLDAITKLRKYEEENGKAKGVLLGGT